MPKGGNTMSNAHTFPFSPDKPCTGSNWPEIQALLSGIQGTFTEPPKGIVTMKYSSGTLMGNGDIGVVAGDTADRQKFYFGKNDFWGAAVKLSGNLSHRWQESILSLGGLTLHSPEAGVSPASIYRMEQDILNAEVRTTMQFSGTTVRLCSWTADSGNLFITELTSESGSSDLVLSAELWLPTVYQYDNEFHNCANIYPYASGVDSGTLWVTRENYNQDESDHWGNYKVKAAIAVKLLGPAFDTTAESAGKATGTFTLRSGTSAYIVTAFESGKGIVGESSCPEAHILREAAVRTLSGLTINDLLAIKKEHREWWKEFWLKSYVRLNDSILEEYYYGALYVLGCTWRSGSFPPSLFGNWITTDNTSWGGRYFLNYNEEAPLYGVFSSNRPELSHPYIDLILADIPYQQNRTHAAGYEGLTFQRSLTPYHLVKTPPPVIPVAPVKDWQKLPSDQKSNGVFAVLPLIWYYEYTQDTEFLKEKLYPLLKELDAFWRSYLILEQKPYCLEHTSAHEGSDDINPNLDLGFIRKVCKTLIETSKVLNMDSDMLPVWQDVLENLSDYPTTVFNGKRVYTEAAAKKGNTDPDVIFHVGCQPVNLEGCVFPGEDISLGGDPEKLQIARASLEQLQGWCVTPGGNSHNGFPKVWPVAARVGWPAEDLFEKLKAAILHLWRPSNLTVFQGGGGIETSGAIEGINSMLLQSESGVLRVFPVWPSARDAKFVRLRAKGAFLVSSEYTGGKVSYVEITSEKGNPVTLKNPWTSGASKVTEVDSTGTFQGEVTYTSLEGKIIFDTAAGKHYRIILQV